MAILATVAVVIQVLSAIGVIVLVLLQHGKGADMGAAFGSGSSGSLFGATGSANFLSRMTGVLATVFFVCTLALAFFANSRTLGREPTSVMDSMAPPAATTPAPSGTGPAAIPGQAAPTAPGAQPGVDATQKSGGAGDIPK
jgi:preprotein translocase subunit SecG